MKRILLGAIALASALALVGCKPSVSAKDVCAQIEAGGIGTGCRAEKPGGIGGGATEKYVFDLPSVPGKTGQILKFATADELAVSAAAFQGMSMFAGPHRYESKRALIFVQMNKDTPGTVGAQAKMLVDAL